MNKDSILVIIVLLLAVMFWPKGGQPAANVGKLPAYQPNQSQPLQMETGGRDNISLGNFAPMVSVAQPQALTGLIGEQGNLDPGVLGQLRNDALGAMGQATPLPPIYGVNCPIAGGWENGLGSGHANCWPPDFADWTQQAQIDWIRAN